MNTLVTPRWVRIETITGILHAYGLDYPAVLDKLNTDDGLLAVERALGKALSIIDDKQDVDE